MPEESSRKNFLPTFLLLAIFFGLSEETTRFFFPEIGTQVVRTIQFYLIAIIALKEYSQFKYPTVFNVFTRYVISFPIFFVGLILILGGTLSIDSIPKADDVVIETIISFSENILVIYLFPSIWGLGSYNGTLYGSVVLNRVRFHLPAITVITALHTGRYAISAGYDFDSFIMSIIIVFVLFCVIVALKEKFNLGVSEGFHAAWNTVLLKLTGTII